MAKEIIDAIYWRLHSAFLRNHRWDADRFLAMLRSEGDDAAIMAELGLPHYERYRVISERMGRGEYGRLYGTGYEVEMDEWSEVSEKSGPEKEFCLALLHDRQGLMDAIGAANPCDIVPELDMDEFGRVDFLLREGRTWHVAEVKMGNAPFSVISQVDKYRLAAELDMCIGRHDEVKAAVIAEGFPAPVATELSRMSVLMITHHGDPADLRRIT